MNIPKTMGACADKLYKLREKRYELGRQIKEIEEEEAAIKKYVIDNLSKQEADGVSGKLANIRVKTENVPTVTDWEAFYKYITRNKSFDMLQKRINVKAVRERIEDKKDFASKAGIGSFTTVSVSITKL